MDIDFKRAFLSSWGTGACIVFHSCAMPREARCRSDIYVLSDSGQTARSRQKNEQFACVYVVEHALVRPHQRHRVVAHTPRVL